jgi:hypothetical protein
MGAWHRSNTVNTVGDHRRPIRTGGLYAITCHFGLTMEGATVGIVVGAWVGLTLGLTVGAPVGACVGSCRMGASHRSNTVNTRGRTKATISLRSTCKEPPQTDSPTCVGALVGCVEGAVDGGGELLGAIVGQTVPS